jgi:hypothetical protein
MQRWGKTSAGKTRYRCPQCHQTTTWKRKDIQKHWLPIFLKHLLQSSSLQQLALEVKVSYRTLTRQLAPYWLVCPLPLKQKASSILIVDGLYLQGRRKAVLIIRSLLTVLTWYFAERENWQSWLKAFKQLGYPSDYQPEYVVCDGQKGLIKAIHQLWPEAKIQRCLIHLVRGVTNKISHHPKTQAGQELYLLSLSLTQVWTRRQKRRWLRRFFRWQKKYQAYLNERSYGFKSSGRKYSWYTHKQLRSAYRLLYLALPDMFRYVGHYQVPRTSNLVEGGINVRLKELFYNHRGLPLWKKQILTAYFLRSKQQTKLPKP